MTWSPVRAEFERLAAASPGERETRLAELLRADPDLAREVGELLAHDSAAPDFLERERGPGKVGASAPATPRPSLRLGRYELLRFLGAGGMGEVWEAAQADPARRVALKILRSGGWSRADRSRFRHEAETLARLVHPSIARLYDAGLSAPGYRDAGDRDGGELSWIAMELVEDARDLVSFADTEHLHRDRRLDLFLEVCAAVQHGHLHGVIHRDLKPANILVGRDGRPKLIDFGIARAVGGHDAGPSLRTRTGEIIGTLSFMAPEQLAGRPDEVDARCDVYALGVILYRLVCGALPFDFARASLPEIARIVREVEPRRPSAVAPGLAGDLDWILLKALAKEHSRRYQSVADLVEDLRRLRAHEPVLAHAPSTWYRLTKLVRRRRAAAAIVATMLAGIGVALVGLTSGLRRARAGESAAYEAAQQADQQRTIATEQAARARREQERAEVEAGHARAALELVEGLFDRVDSTVKGRDVRVADLLDARQRTDSAFRSSDPEVEFVGAVVIGGAYVRLGLYEEARTVLDRGLSFYEGIDPARADHRRHIDARSLLGAALTNLGEPDEGECLLRDALAAAEARGTDELWERCMLALMGQLSEKRSSDELLLLASELRDAATANRRERARLRALAFMGFALQDLNRSAEATPLFAEVWSAQARLYGERDSRTVTALFNWCNSMQEAGQLDAVEDTLPYVLELAREAFGPDHDLTLTALGNHAMLAVARRDFASAAERMSAVVATYDRRGRPPTWDHIRAINNHGMALNQMRDFEAAEPILRRAAELSRQVLAPDDLNAVGLRFNHGACLAWMHRFDEAEPLLLESYGTMLELANPADAMLRKARRTLADAYQENGDPAEAARWRDGP